MNRESRREQTTETLREILRLIAEKKGEETVVLDVEGSLIGADLFVITAADNPRQLQAIAENIKKGLSREPLAFEGRDSSVWIVLDYGEVMVHVFERQARSFYDLEGLWGDRPLDLDLPH